MRLCLIYLSILLQNFRNQGFGLYVEAYWQQKLKLALQLVLFKTTQNDLAISCPTLFFIPVATSKLFLEAVPFYSVLQ